MRSKDNDLFNINLVVTVLPPIEIPSSLSQWKLEMETIWLCTRVLGFPGDILRERYVRHLMFNDDEIGVCPVKIFNLCSKDTSTKIYYMSGSDALNHGSYYIEYEDKRYPTNPLTERVNFVVKVILLILPSGRSLWERE